MRLEEQEGKTQPRLWSAFLLNPRTNPALQYPSLGRMGATLLGYPHPAALHIPIMPGCTGDSQEPRESGNGRA